MIKFNGERVSFNKTTQTITVNIKMSKEMYDDIKTPDKVQDVGLGFLSAIERCLNGDLLDGPEAPIIKNV